MKPLFLIIQREYLARLKNRVFIILTLLMPFLIALSSLLPLLLSSIKDNEVKNIAVIDTTGHYADLLQSTNDYHFMVSSQPIKEAQKQLGKELFGVLYISGNLIDHPNAATFYSKKQGSRDLFNTINNALSEDVKTSKLNQLKVDENISSETLTEIQKAYNDSRITVSTIKMDNEGRGVKTSSDVISIIGIAFSFLIYFFVITYGGMVMQGVIEEKTNRIVEVMVSSVRPFHLMMGKIIGIGLVGLTQLSIWGIMLGILFSFKGSIIPADIGSSMNDTISMIGNLNWVEIISCFVIYFIGGYLLFASIFAMFGSAVDNAQDSQQFMMPVIFIIIFALYAGMSSAQNPDGPLAFWCSMIPITSPIVMMVRIPSGVAWTEILSSMVILFTTILLTVKLAGKVYRVGILIYGKKPNFRELYKWMKYK